MSVMKLVISFDPENNEIHVCPGHQHVKCPLYELPLRIGIDFKENKDD